MTRGPICGVSEEGISGPAGNDLGSCLIPSPAVGHAGSMASLISNPRNLSRQQNFSEEEMMAQGMEFITEATKQLYLKHMLVLP